MHLVLHLLLVTRVSFAKVNKDVLINENKPLKQVLSEANTKKA